MKGYEDRRLSSDDVVSPDDRTITPYDEVKRPPRSSEGASSAPRRRLLLPMGLGDGACLSGNHPRPRGPIGVALLMMAIGRKQAEVAAEQQ